jgi:hypothetical protein
MYARERFRTGGSDRSHPRPASKADPIHVRLGSPRMLCAMNRDGYTGGDDQWTYSDIASEISEVNLFATFCWHRIKLAINNNRIRQFQ